MRDLQKMAGSEWLNFLMRERMYTSCAPISSLLKALTTSSPVFASCFRNCSARLRPFQWRRPWGLCCLSSPLCWAVPWPPLLWVSLPLLQEPLPGIGVATAEDAEVGHRGCLPGLGRWHGGHPPSGAHIQPGVPSSSAFSWELSPPMSLTQESPSQLCHLLQSGDRGAWECFYSSSCPCALGLLCNNKWAGRFVGRSLLVCLELIPLMYTTASTDLVTWLVPQGGCLM